LLKRFNDRDLRRILSKQHEYRSNGECLVLNGKVNISIDYTLN